MKNKFFSSKKNIVTFAIAVTLSFAIVLTVVLLLVVKSPRPNFVSGTFGDYSVYYDKNGIDTNLILKEYKGECLDDELTIPETIKINNIVYTVSGLGNEALSGEKNNSLKSIVKLNLPNTIKSIGDAAFKDTINLEAVELMGKVDSYGNYLFIGSGVKSLTINTLTPGFKLNTFSGTAEQVVAFEKVIINNIVGEGEDFIKNFSSLKTNALFLGQNILDASMLKNVIKNVKILSISKDTVVNFVSDTLIETLYLNNVGTSLEKTDFENFSNLKTTVKNIYLDEKCDTIYAEAFDGFNYLENLFISSTSISVSLDMFKNANMANVRIQENIMDICLYLNAGDEKVLTAAFMSKFTNLDIVKQVYIENGITEIKANALAGMGEGKTIYFYDNSTVTTIETGAFGTTKVYVWGPKDSNHAVYKRLKLSEDFATNVLQYNGQ